MLEKFFYHVNLDEESSKLTKMINPFAWCRWRRIPYGLKVSARSFSASLKDLFSVVDDVVVAAYGQKMKQAQIDNMQELTDTFKRCAEINIVLNEDKQQTHVTAVIFHGHRITKDGAKADEVKVQAIRDMPGPTYVAHVNLLCGMVQ